MNTRRKKISFWLVLFIFAAYAAGFFSPPRIRYVCTVELDPMTESAKNISVVLPFPYYDPLPWFSHVKMLHAGRPIRLIAHTLKAAGAAKNVQVQLMDDSKRGQALQVFIPELNHAAREMLTHKIILEFPETFPLPLFLTPAYFFKQPSDIFYLNPWRTTIYWEEKDKGFAVNRKHYSYVKVSGESPNARLKIRVEFAASRRYFFGSFFVKQEMALTEEKIPGTASWRKIPLEATEKKSLL